MDVKPLAQPLARREFTRCNCPFSFLPHVTLSDAGYPARSGTPREELDESSCEQTLLMCVNSALEDFPVCLIH